ncbi:MAG: Crp/Fnr family transcriptional regulator [Pseudomonadota bacterium]
MNLATPRNDRPPYPDQGEAAFKDWLRRLVTGTEELRAFDAGEIDAVMDHASESALMLPEARSAQLGTSNIALSALDALPGEVCVIDQDGTVILANKAWRAFVAQPGAGLRVREGGNFLVACRNAPESECAHAEGLAVSLRQVLSGAKAALRRQYAYRDIEGSHACTLTIAALPGKGAVHAVVTRERTGKRNPPIPRGLVRSGRSRMATVAPTSISNHLLVALLPAQYARLTKGAETVALNYGDVLYEPGEQMHHVYFPDNSLVSLLTLVEGHRALEVGLVGREGMIGARLAFGASTSSVRALVQGTGTALKIKSTHFLREFHRNPNLQRVLLHFMDGLMIQVSQTAACNRFHIVESRLARWLLMTAERMASGSFHLTQAFLADMLGVRRVGVTTAASALQRRKLIRYRRGDITILDQHGLEAASCSCYQYVRVMGLTTTQ